MDCEQTHTHMVRVCVWDCVVGFGFDASVHLRADCEVPVAPNAGGVAFARSIRPVAAVPTPSNEGFRWIVPPNSLVVVRATRVVAQVPPGAAAVAGGGVCTTPLLPREFGLVQEVGIGQSSAAVIEARLVGLGTRRVRVLSKRSRSTTPVEREHPRLVPRADAVLDVCDVAHGGRGGVGVEHNGTARGRGNTIAAGGHDGRVHRPGKHEPVRGGPLGALERVERGVACARVVARDGIAIGVEKVGG